ncbi:hypothetical protein SDJN02_13086, partial [Cucurbita argyrosperma subsp. argyrosperma]
MVIKEAGKERARQVAVHVMRQLTHPNLADHWISLLLVTYGPQAHASVSSSSSSSSFLASHGLVSLMAHRPIQPGILESMKQYELKERENQRVAVTKVPRSKEMLGVNI